MPENACNTFIQTVSNNGNKFSRILETKLNITKGGKIKSKKHIKVQESDTV